jgi:hypothetical protein
MEHIGGRKKGTFSHERSALALHCGDEKKLKEIVHYNKF